MDNTVQKPISIITDVI